MRTLKRVAVYCGSSDAVHPDYLEAARDVGRALASRGIGVVYGGGNVGLMGACADAALSAGGEVIGVIPIKLRDLERAHQGLSELIVVDSMHGRKMVMASLSSAFIALPGGYGTLDELFEAITWSQLGYHQKPCGVLDVRSYFSSLLAFVEHARAEGFVRPALENLLVSETTIEGLLDRLQNVELPQLGQWLVTP